MEDTGQDVTKVLLDAPSHGFYRHVDAICWENQTPGVTKMLLDLMRRLIKQTSGQEGQDGDEEAHPALYKLHPAQESGTMGTMPQ